MGSQKGMSTSITADRQGRPDTPTEIEANPATVADTPELICRRAARLEALGRSNDARQLYLGALAEAPEDAALLNGLGALLYRTGYHSAARTTYERVVTCHPGQPIGHTNLGNLLYEAGDPDGARRHYEIALRLAPEFPEAHQGLGNVLAACGDAAAAEHHWRLGYRDRVVNTWPYRGPGQPIHVLMLISVTNGNVPARVFLDDRLFAVTTVAMEFYTAALALPPHDLVLNAIGDADLCGTALLAAVDLLDRTTAPVINHPASVLQTGRAQNARRFAEIPGVTTPRCMLLPRELLADPGGDRLLASLGFGWPVLLRAPGFHTGQHFVRVDTAAELPGAVAALPGAALLAIQYIDATGADGQSRKGRVLIVNGQLYPLHWAISSNWKVHYFTADMADCKDYRVEEARFLADMPAFIGPRAVAALGEVARRLDLDYGGIDFGIGADGQVVLFEANASMAIVPPPVNALWNYRSVAINRPLLATKGLLMARARSRMAATG
jgi:tetratricopeptide (TPR) repeat protein